MRCITKVSIVLFLFLSCVFGSISDHYKLVMVMAEDAVSSLLYSYSLLVTSGNEILMTPSTEVYWCGNGGLLHVLKPDEFMKRIDVCISVFLKENNQDHSKFENKEFNYFSTNDFKNQDYEVRVDFNENIAKLKSQTSFSTITFEKVNVQFIEEKEVNFIHLVSENDVFTNPTDPNLSLLSLTNLKLTIIYETESKDLDKDFISEHELLNEKFKIVSNNFICNGLEIFWKRINLELINSQKPTRDTFGKYEISNPCFEADIIELQYKSFFEGECFKEIKNPLGGEDELEITGTKSGEDCENLISKVLRNKDIVFKCKNCEFNQLQDIQIPKNKNFLMLDHFNNVNKFLQDSQTNWIDLKETMKNINANDYDAFVDYHPHFFVFYTHYLKEFMKEKFGITEIYRDQLNGWYSGLMFLEEDVVSFNFKHASLISLTTILSLMTLVLMVLTIFVHKNYSNNLMQYLKK